MVKGISRQVIVVQSPDKKLFDQAIFILAEGAMSPEGVSDTALLKEAQRLLSSKPRHKQRLAGPVWAAAGAVATGLVWLVSVLV